MRFATVVAALAVVAPSLCAPNSSVAKAPFARSVRPSSSAAVSSIAPSSAVPRSSSVPAPAFVRSARPSSVAAASSSVRASSSAIASSSIRPSSSAAASPSPSAVVGPSQAYIDAVLFHHNVHRSNHSAPAMTWSAPLAAIALQTAQTCVYAHDTTTGGGGYGQNIAAGYPTITTAISDGWYNGEVNAYTYYGGEPDINTLGAWGHMSQVVWVNSVNVGCATVDCSARPGGLQGTGSNIPPIFYVCNYQPAGNYVGQFAANVLRPLGRPTVVGATTGP